jgi:hypothetical protein
MDDWGGKPMSSGKENDGGLKSWMMTVCGSQEWDWGLLCGVPWRSEESRSSC